MLDITVCCLSAVLTCSGKCGNYDLEAEEFSIKLKINSFENSEISSSFFICILLHYYVLRDAFDVYKYISAIPI